MIINKSRSLGPSTLLSLLSQALTGKSKTQVSRPSTTSSQRPSRRDRRKAKNRRRMAKLSRRRNRRTA